MMIGLCLGANGGENDFKMMKNLVRISTQDILDSYIIGKVIGEGTTINKKERMRFKDDYGYAFLVS